MESAKFRELYSKLNPQQREAVDTIEGPVMVIAGPGTGKTQILTLRIANILVKADVEPSNILALTFTESGAVAMRRRLVEIIGSPAYYVNVFTFHGFSNEIIKNNPEDFAHLAESRNITEIEQIELLSRLMETAKLAILKPYGAPLLFLRPALSAINDLKREGVSAEKFRQILQEEERRFLAQGDMYWESGAHKGKMKGVYKDRQKQIQKNKELLSLYEEYQKALRESKLYDYSDMILEVIRAMEQDPDFLLTLQEQYQYILVDEHQDTNTAQNRLLELLASFHESPNLFVVGDEKQSIFRFQGASIANFLYFKQRYPRARLITLKESYRSTQTILNAASCVVANLRAPEMVRETRAGLEAKAGHPELKISLCGFSTPDGEFHFVAKDIEQKIKEKGVRPEEIAVLYRDNRDAFEIAEALQKFEVPFVIESDEDLLCDPDVKKLLLIFQAVEHFGEDPYLVSVLHIDAFGIHPHDVYELLRYSSSHNINLWNALGKRAMYEQKEFHDAGKLRGLYSLFSSWKTLSKNVSLPQFFGTALRESGVLAQILAKPDFIDTMDKVTGLFEETKNFTQRNLLASLGDFLRYIDILKTQNILIKKEQTYRRTGSARLMTAHRSKGLEFDYVYILKCHDGHWSNRRVIEHIKLPESVLGFSVQEGVAQSNDEDDRRLFYVALTRARKEVSISFSEFSREGKEQLPAQFIEEISSDLKAVIDGKKGEQELLKDKTLLFAPPKAARSGFEDTQFFRELFLERGLSVTGLNNYLFCPWKYFYINLLRIPQVPSKHQMYGIAAHKALQRFFDARNKGALPSKDFLHSVFEEELKKQPFAPHDREESREKGLRALDGYIDRWQDTWPRKTINEFRVKSLFALEGADTDVASIRLQGILDRLEEMEAGVLLVTDYKTGAPKTRGFIEGATKNSEGGYMMRQLVFYKLLLNLQGQRNPFAKDRGAMKMGLGRIDFVEPDKSGNWHREDFIISDAKVLELAAIIREAAKEILNLSFWERRCDDKKCEFCALREMLGT